MKKLAYRTTCEDEEDVHRILKGIVSDIEALECKKCLTELQLRHILYGCNLVSKWAKRELDPVIHIGRKHENKV